MKNWTTRVFVNPCDVYVCFRASHVYDVYHPPFFTFYFAYQAKLLRKIIISWRSMVLLVNAVLKLNLKTPLQNRDQRFRRPKIVPGEGSEEADVHPMTRCFDRSIDQNLIDSNHWEVHFSALLSKRPASVLQTIPTTMRDNAPQELFFRPRQKKGG